MNILNNSYLTVDLGALRRNAANILSALPAGTELIPVLKCDAYGMGLLPAVRTLAAVPGIERFAVAHVSEGLTLREAGFSQEILVMGCPLPQHIRAAAEAGLTLTLGRLGLVPELAALGIPVRAQIKLDTGLHRIGVEPGEELEKLISELKAAGDVIELTGVFSHFSDAENASLSAAQFELYMQGIKQLENAGIDPVLRHISGSAASELLPQYDLDAVRLGRRLFMDNPTRPLGGIEEPMSWRSFITKVSPRRAGDRLSYFGSVELETDAVIATIGVGYGDGLDQRLAAVKAPTLVNGVRCPLIACCMDQAFVDVSGVDCRPGDEVTLIGSDGRGNALNSQELALMIGGDEGCGLTSALSSRVLRVYTDE